MRNIFIAATVALAALLAPVARADDDGNKRVSVTVSFGAGLNTAQPGNSANHHILPDVIRIRTGGVVNFVVAGFHQPFIYLPGKTPEQVVVPAAGLFINDLDRIYYQGIAPAGTPPAGVSNASNRVESISFPTKGTYLVICNVRPHFLDGMKAWIVVGGDD
jgi:plastocyanin